MPGVVVRVSQEPGRVTLSTVSPPAGIRAAAARTASSRAASPRGHRCPPPGNSWPLTPDTATANQREEQRAAILLVTGGPGERGRRGMSLGHRKRRHLTPPEGMTGNGATLLLRILTIKQTPSLYTRRDSYVENSKPFWKVHKHFVF